MAFNATRRFTDQRKCLRQKPIQSDTVSCPDGKLPRLMLQLSVVGAFKIVLIDFRQYPAIRSQVELDRRAPGKMEVFSEFGNQSHKTWTLEI